MHALGTLRRTSVAVYDQNLIGGAATITVDDSHEKENQCDD